MGEKIFWISIGIKQNIRNIYREILTTTGGSFGMIKFSDEYLLWYQATSADMIWWMFVFYIREDPCYDNGIEDTILSLVGQFHASLAVY